MERFGAGIQVTPAPTLAQLRRNAKEAKRQLDQAYNAWLPYEYLRRGWFDAMRRATEANKALATAQAKRKGR